MTSSEFYQRIDPVRFWMPGTMILTRASRADQRVSQREAEINGMHKLRRFIGRNNKGPRSLALRFVVLLGALSLFGDMIYEGARSITGLYFAVLEASETVVGFIAGLGELIGYGPRLVPGRLADRPGRHWRSRSSAAS